MRNMRGRARAKHTPGAMNKSEAEFAEILKLRQLSGEVVSYGFETVKLKLAPKTFLTLDFFVQYASGEMGFEEVKGHWEDDARVKLKVAAEMFPMFHFSVYKKKSKKNGGGFECVEKL